MIKRALPLIALPLLAHVASAQLPVPPAPPENPVTPEKAVLGKILFWDEQLSSDNTTACGTCHIPSAGGADPRTGPPNVNPGPDGVAPSPDDIFGSPGVMRADDADDYVDDATFGFDVQVTGRQANSAIGAVFHEEVFWDGRASSTFVEPEGGQLSILAGGGLESQVVGPPLSDVEMAHEGRSWDQIAEKLEDARPLRLASALTPDIVTALASHPTYPDLFTAAFGSPEITAERIAFAVATYERTLVPDETPFDLGTMTPQQAQGFNVFNGPGARCNLCHTAPLFTDDDFHTLGVRPPAEDLGRQLVTGSPADRGRFKTPSLRNVGLRQRFMHNGRFGNLGAVVNFYRGGGGFPDNRDPLLAPFNLPPQANNALLAFLTEALTDPRVANELPPFDRPRLHSEDAVEVPPVVSRGNPGTGGVLPTLIAVSPSAAGVDGFRLGVASGLGGAVAFLDLAIVAGGAAPSFTVTSAGPTSGGAASASAATASIRRPLGDFRTVVRLAGDGAGEGYGTYPLQVPTSLAGLGLKLQAQWWILDPGAPGGYARTERVELEIL